MHPRNLHPGAMPTHRHTASIVLLLGLGTGTWAQNPPDPQAPEGSRANPLQLTLPDSLRAIVAIDSTLEFEAFEVRGERIDRAPKGGRDLIGLSAVESVDAGSASELAPLLQSTRVATNSRGESLFSVRGSSERHVGVFWDGIPLVVPWDERVDLSLVPVDALGGVRALRGMPDLAGGPQVLAGRVELRPWRLAQIGSESQLSVGGGEVAAYELRGAHARKTERWDLLIAAGHRDRDGFVLEEDFVAPYNQGDGRLLRTNSDRRQSSGLFSARRVLGEDSELRLLLLGSDAEKGVPPETHVSDARFWRYPSVRRGLAGLSGTLHAGASREWEFDFATSADIFQQEVREFDDASYSSPDELPGADYESDRDLTLYGQLGMTRSTRDFGSFSLTGVGRRTSHRESLVVDGPESEFVQNLLSIVGEWRLPLGAGFAARFGAGYERASTPEAGELEAGEATDAPVWLATLERSSPRGWEYALRYSRRSRAPSLREAYSGALGRFVVNPDLEPERQDLIELDVSREYARGGISGAAFASMLDGSIERVALPNNQFQRSNAQDLRVLGVELGANLLLMDRLRAGWRFTALHARLRIDEEYDQYAEDRPEFLSSFWMSWVHPVGLRVRVENQSTGARASAGTTGLLPAHTLWNLRVAYLLFGGPASLSETELFVRIDNVADALAWSQTGLPEPGQSLWLGARLKFR